MAVTKEKEALSASGDVDNDEMEQEEMWVDAHPSLSTDKREWGGPTRGGRLLEPTRFGDWEQKGRCSDFYCIQRLWPRVGWRYTLYNVLLIYNIAITNQVPCFALSGLWMHQIIAY